LKNILSDRELNGRIGVAGEWTGRRLFVDIKGRVVSVKSECCVKVTSKVPSLFSNTTTASTSSPSGSRIFKENFESYVVKPYEWKKNGVNPNPNDFGHNTKDLLGNLMWRSIKTITTIPDTGSKTLLSAILISLSRRSIDEFNVFSRLGRERDEGNAQVEALFEALDDSSHAKDIRKKLSRCFYPNQSAEKCLNDCADYSTYYHRSERRKLHVATFVLMAHHSMKHAKCLRSCCGPPVIEEGASGLWNKYLKLVDDYRGSCDGVGRPPKKRTMITTEGGDGAYPTRRRLRGPEETESSMFLQECGRTHA
jgi:hypothetical protein